MSLTEAIYQERMAGAKCSAPQPSQSLPSIQAGNLSANNATVEEFVSLGGEHIAFVFTQPKKD